jgi:hypothetical protein
MLMIVLHEDAALPIDATIGTIDQVVSAVVSVRGIEPRKHDGLGIGAVITVSVFDVEEFGLSGDEDSVVPELEAERVLRLGENLGTLGFAIAIVFEDQ